MNNIDQMIEVLNAYKRGEKIEFKSIDYPNWTPCDPTGPIWNFHKTEYRVAKPEPKMVHLSAWLDSDGELRQVRDPAAVPNEWIRIPEEDKEITLP